MADRTLGWVQNPSSFENLKNVVSVFDKKSEMYKSVFEDKIPRLVKDVELKNVLLEELKKEPLVMDYVLLKGQGVKGGQSRRDAECSGIIQAAITTQTGREYTDDWTADGFLRWAISIGLLKYNLIDDTVNITELGTKFIGTETVDEENEILITAFLSYPPAVRILTLLENGDHLTKFEIGSQLGGLGEAGFTSIPQNLYIQAIETAEPEEMVKIRSNTEGSADKYARMICGWLIKVGLVQKVDKKVTTVIGEQEYSATIGHSFMITIKGLNELKRSKGTSSYSKLNKIVYWQMLATKVKDRDYIRNRRGYIIESINNKRKTLDEIREYLKSKDIVETNITIEDELKVVEAMGISVNKSKDGYAINDNIICLEIPGTRISKTNVLELKDKVREKLEHVDHRYLSLIDLAYDGTADRDFEVQTIDLLTNELEFEGVRLGGARKPDGIFSYDKKGVIVDNKAYSKGYNLPLSHADEMNRYVIENQKRDKALNANEWWLNFDEIVNSFNFLFVSSYFKGGVEYRLENISYRTKVNGAAINVENLLYLAEELKSGRLDYSDSFMLYEDREIIKDDIVKHEN